MGKRGKGTSVDKGGGNAELMHCTHSCISDPALTPCCADPQDLNFKRQPKCPFQLQRLDHQLQHKRPQTTPGV